MVVAFLDMGAFAIGLCLTGVVLSGSVQVFLKGPFFSTCALEKRNRGELLGVDVLIFCATINSRELFPLTGWVVVSSRCYLLIPRPLLPPLGFPLPLMAPSPSGPGPKSPLGKSSCQDPSSKSSSGPLQPSGGP